MYNHGCYLVFMQLFCELTCSVQEYLHILIWIILEQTEVQPVPSQQTHLAETTMTIK